MHLSIFQAHTIIITFTASIIKLRDCLQSTRQSSTVVTVIIICLPPYVNIDSAVGSSLSALVPRGHKHHQHHRLPCPRHYSCYWCSWALHRSHYLLPTAHDANPFLGDIFGLLFTIPRNLSLHLSPSCAKSSSHSSHLLSLRPKKPKHSTLSTLSLE